MLGYQAAKPRQKAFSSHTVHSPVPSEVNKSSDSQTITHSANVEHGCKEASLSSLQCYETISFRKA